jgi:hypothetical protein
MDNPIDLLGVDPAGGAQKRYDSRDYQWDTNEIVQASAPFEWKNVNDPDAELAKVLGDSSFLMPRKNQGQSGSCGGQASAYGGQILSKTHRNDGRERSAKYHYSQVYVPGGGSDPRSLANISIKQGFGLESLTPSYQGGNPPTEGFMERPQDITPGARISAAQDQMMLAYAFPRVDLETVGQAISSTTHGLLLVHGSNNGTWLSEVPQSPSYRPQGAPNSPWSHYMCGVLPGIYYGKKGIWSLQSWGASAGHNGWQFLNEDYFSSGNIVDVMTLIFNEKPNQPPQHTFNTDIKFGTRSPDVLALQQFLAYDGEFNLDPTGYYGAVTANAVLNFQLKYQLASLYTLQELGGHIVGPATRAKLNTLVSLGITH